MPHRMQSGFTLIELTIVIVIASIVFFTAQARWNGYKISINTQSYQLAYDIKRAQSLAMSKNAAYRVNIVSSTTYTITDSAGTILPQSGTNLSTITLRDGAAFGTLTNLPSSLISFNARGEPGTNTTATTLLSSTASIVISLGSVSQTVSIAPKTGFATVT